MSTAHFGTFDVDNYGDCLFPLIFERRMAAAGLKCVHISPRGIPTRWLDGPLTISIEEASATSRQFTGAVVGGGHIIRGHPTGLQFYNFSTLSGYQVYPSLWLSASAIAHQNRIPLCWNAPGVPRPLSGRLLPLLQRSLSDSRYIAVRDSQSCDNLLVSGTSLRVHVVPDTALEVHRLWTNDELELAYRAVFREQARLVPERSVVFSVKRKYVRRSIRELARILDGITTFLKADPLLLALGPCHGDDEIALAVAKRMTTGPLVRIPRSLREVAACIAHAKLYAGSSLHGAITAVSFRIPTVVVADEERAKFRKFSGFLAQVGLPGALCCSWEHAEDYVHVGKHVHQWNDSCLQQAFTILEDHWTSLIGALTFTSGKQSKIDGRDCKAPSLDALDDPIRLKSTVHTSGDEGSEGGSRAEEGHSFFIGSATPVTKWVRENSFPSIDVIVCIYNALEDVKKCLDSVLNHTDIPYTLHLINDGSDEATSEYLREFALNHGSQFLVNEFPLGYTRAANIGLRNSHGEFILLLNSDTVVSSRWLEKILECACSDTKIGIVGPLSNAAAYQSVPFTKDQSRKWVTNTLPAGLSPALADVIVERVSRRKFPRVPFLNGFCLLLKREVISQIGYFDEENFPLGYGEELDYCIRALKAGLELAVADHVYVFHAKSASYGHAQRIALSKVARARLDEKHGAETLAAARANLEQNHDLASIRQQIAMALEEYGSGSTESPTTRTLINRH